MDGHGEMEINNVETKENGRGRKRDSGYILKLEYEYEIRNMSIFQAQQGATSWLLIVKYSQRITASTTRPIRLNMSLILISLDGVQ